MLFRVHSVCFGLFGQDWMDYDSLQRLSHSRMLLTVSVHAKVCVHTFKNDLQGCLISKGKVQEAEASRQPGLE